MAIDFTKPSISENYSSAFVPNILLNTTALGRWLDTRNESIVGTPPTYTKRYNNGVQQLEEYNGTSWVTLSLAYVLKTGDSLTGGLSIQPASGAGISIRGAAATNSQASWQSDNGGGSRFWISSTASVLKLGGIGTTDPAVHPVHINNTGNVIIAAPGSGDTLTVAAGGDGLVLGGNLRMNASTAQLNSYATVATEIAGRSNAPMAFYTNNLLRLTIAAAGNVTLTAPSIGTALAVTGITGNNIATFSASAGATVGIQATVGQGYIGTNTNHPLEIYTNNISRVVISAAGAVSISGSAVLTASTGITLAGNQVVTGIKNFTSTASTATASGQNSLEAYSTAGNPAVMAFHRSGLYAVNMGLDADNIFRIGGWSAPANLLQLSMTGNLQVTSFMVPSGQYLYDSPSTYGAMALAGSKGGYTGIYLTNGAGTNIGMYDASGNGGTYHGDTGIWHMYWNTTNQCLALGGSGTQLNYRVSTNGNHYVDGSLLAAGNITAYSDIRLKTDVETMDNALSKVGMLRGITYRRIDTDERSAGVIAQDVVKVLPDAIILSPDDMMSVNYNALVGLVIEAIKELSMKVNILEARQ